VSRVLVPRRVGMRALGYLGQGDDSDYEDSLQYAADVGSTVEYTPSLGPATGGGFTAPSGALIPASDLSNSPFANPATVMAEGSSPNALQVGQTDSVPSSSGAPSSVTVPGSSGSGISSILSSIFGPSTAPAPRASTLPAYSPVSSSTIIPGVPDIMVYGMVIVGVVVLASSAKKR
jgi:hypothetical protein